MTKDASGRLLFEHKQPPAKSEEKSRHDTHIC